MFLTLVSDVSYYCKLRFLLSLAIVSDFFQIVSDVLTLVMFLTLVSDVSYYFDVSYDCK